jgi:hypothetical protein
MRDGDKITCPICDGPEAHVQCDEADVGVGVIVGNVAIECKLCGFIMQCDECFEWVGPGDTHGCWQEEGE